MIFGVKVFGRRVSWVLAGLSVLVAIAAVGVGAWSFFESETFEWRPHKEYLHAPVGYFKFECYSMTISRGEVGFFHDYEDWGVSYGGGPFGWSYKSSRPAHGLVFAQTVLTARRFRPIQYNWYFAGFDLVHYVVWRPANHLIARIDSYYVAVPLWPLLIVPVPVVVWWYLRRRRVKAGCCLKCGYDLRATPERCPECGEEVVVAG
jgi:hypothetical protein